MTGIAVPRLRNPSIGEAYAQSAANSLNPGLWDRLLGAWVPELGFTGLDNVDSTGHRKGRLTVLDAGDWEWDVDRLSIRHGRSNGRIELGSVRAGEDLTLSSGTYTINVWMTPRSGAPSFARIVDKSTGVTGTNGYSLWLNGASLGFNVNNNRYETGGSPFPANLRRMTTISSNGSRYQFWRDAETIGGSFISGGYETPVNNTAPMRIANWNHQTDKQFSGNIFSVMIWDRELSQGELASLFHDSIAPFRLRHRVFSIPAAGPQPTFKPWYSRHHPVQGVA